MTKITSTAIASGAVPLEQTQVGEGRQEGQEAGSVQVALADATSDPGSYVEQTATFAQSEAVETTLTTLVTNVVVKAGGGLAEQTGSAASQATGGLTQGSATPARIDKDTGQMIPGGGGGAGSGAGESGAEQSQGGSGSIGSGPGIQPGGGLGEQVPQSGAGEGGQAAASEGAGSAAIPALDGSSALPAEKTAAGAAGGLVPEELPEQARLPVGEGTQGMIEKPGAEHGLGAPELPEKYGGGQVNRPGMGKGTSSGGYGKPGTVTGNVPGGPQDDGKMGGGRSGGSGKKGGTSSSDSGPPVGYGLGGKGKGDGKGKGGGKGSGGKGGGGDRTGALCRYKDTLEMQGWTCKKENGKTYCYSPDGKSKTRSAAWDRCYTIDGDQPMPYTGKSFGGEEPEDPRGPIGGKDHESGSFFVVVTRGGKGGGGGSGGGEPGDHDDSGKFYGGVWGSDDNPPPPDDDIPYNVVG